MGPAVCPPQSLRTVTQIAEIAMGESNVSLRLVLVISGIVAAMREVDSKG